MSDHLSEPKLPLYTRINGPLLELSFYLLLAVYSGSATRTVHLFIFIDFFGTNIEHEPKKLNCIELYCPTLALRPFYFLDFVNSETKPPVILKYYENSFRIFNIEKIKLSKS